MLRWSVGGHYAHITLGLKDLTAGDSYLHLRMMKFRDLEFPIWMNILFYFFLIFIVIQLQLSAFSPTPPPHRSWTHLPPPPQTSPFGFVHVSFIVVPENPSPHYPLPTPLWLLLDCS